MVEYTKDVADRVLRILKASGTVPADELKEYLLKADSRSAAALDLLMKERVDEELVLTILSRAYALRRKTISPDEISEEAVKAVPSDMITKHFVLPFAREGRFLRVGTVDPTKATLAAVVWTGFPQTKIENASFRKTRTESLATP